MLIYSSLFLLLSSAVTLRRDKAILYSRVAITTLLYSASLAFTTSDLNSLGRGVGIYGGLFHATSISQTFHLFIFIVSAAIMQLTAFHPRKVWLEQYSSVNKLFFKSLLYYRTKISNKMAEQFKIIEYPLILLFIITGASFLVSSSDLVSIFLSIELQSYGLYLVCTLYRNSELATSAGLSYFLLGGLSSCFILLGTSLLYANSGTTSLDGLYVITNLSDMTTVNSTGLASTSQWYQPNYISMSLLIFSVGFLFKVSAAPFHFWSPDVYDAIPTVVTTFVAILAKISIFVFLLEIVHYTSDSLFASELSWTSSLLLSSLLSLLIGTIVGLTQFRIKRLFAYSTISHVGFILLALSINSIESTQAFIFYLMQYSLSNLNAFVILISIGFSLFFYVNNHKSYKELLDKNNSPIQLLSQIQGYFYINPVLALSFAVTIFSFVGIPPLLGFFAKQMVLSAALDSGYVFITLVAILTSVISAVYYLNIIKQIFFDQPEYELNPALDGMSLHANIRSLSGEASLTGKVSQILDSSAKTADLEKVTFKLGNIVLSSSLTITISLLTLVITLFMCMPDQWLSMANILALIIFNL